MNKKLKFQGIHEAVHEVATVSYDSSYNGWIFLFL